MLDYYECTYRLFLHPCSKCPGPLLAKLTDWYGTCYATIGDLHVNIWQCHQKYGKHSISLAL